MNLRILSSGGWRQCHLVASTPGCGFCGFPFHFETYFVTHKVPQKPFSLTYYQRRKSVKLKSAVRRGWPSIQWNHSAELEPGNQTRAVSLHQQNGPAAGIPACRRSDITSPLLLKQTPWLSYFLAPTDCFPFRFSLVHISISRLCILLPLLLKYCFFLSFFFKDPF